MLLKSFINQLDNKIPQGLAKKKSDDVVSISQQVKSGFVVVDNRVNPVKFPKISIAVYTKLCDMFKVDTRCFNSTFFSKQQMNDLEDDKKMALQIIHYFSTYGLESLGCTSMPFVPNNQVEFRDGKPKFITAIAIADDITLFELFKKRLKTIVKPTEETIDEITDIFNYMITYHKDLIETIQVNDIKSRELQMLFYKITQTVPQNNIDFLRYEIYKATGSTLLIKDDRTISYLIMSINSLDKKQQAEFIEDWKKINLIALAEIFYRYKVLILAFREIEELRPLINRIRRLAVRYHKPAKLTGVNYFFTNFKNADTEDINAELSKYSNTDLIKLLNYDENNKIYYIRNGKIFYKKGEQDE